MTYKYLEVPRIEISIKSDKKSVKDFLEELFCIVDSNGFNPDRDFLLIKSSKENREYSTPYTMVDLEYDNKDVIDRIRELSIADYSETLFDKDDEHPPLLFVFGKEINSKLVYIKLKIKGLANKRILCVSFHYAKHKMNFPYA